MNLLLDTAQDIRQSNAYSDYVQTQGWQTHTFDDSGQYIYLKRWPIIGSVIKFLRSDRPFSVPALHDFLKSHRVMTARIEPYLLDTDTLGGLVKAGFVVDTHPLRPTKTIRIDLRPNQDQILQSFRRARSWINKLQDESVQISKNNFDLFYSIWDQAARQQHIWRSTKLDYDNLISCFKGSAFCITINDTAGCLILIHNATAYYFYAAALPVAKEQNLPYLVVWEAIKEAKRMGCTRWDFESIYDPRWGMYPKWQGFTQFKKTFGGTEIEYPNCYIKNDLFAIFGH